MDRGRPLTWKLLTREPRPMGCASVFIRGIFGNVILKFGAALKNKVVSSARDAPEHDQGRAPNQNYSYHYSSFATQRCVKGTPLLARPSERSERARRYC